MKQQLMKTQLQDRNGENDAINSKVYSFADDTKICRELKTKNDNLKLQGKVNNICE